MTKEEFIEIIEHSFEKGTPFINMLEFYSYALIPKGDKWLEVVYDFQEKAVSEKNELGAEQAFFKLCEEVEKAMSEEVEDFMLVNWKEFKISFNDNFNENLTKSIKELTSNSTKYSKNLPIIFNKDDFAKLKDRL